MDSRNKLIVVGDSFCSWAPGWPGQLASLLNLQLLSAGYAGAGWWPVKQYIDKIDTKTLDQTEVIVLVHTNAERIPTPDLDLVLYNIANLNLNNEKELALHLYYKYIHDIPFLLWAQQQWFNEINQRFNNKKVCHLHSFEYSTGHNNLNGMNIGPDLCSISLSEHNINMDSLVNETRGNHLSLTNNTALAHELARLISNYQPGCYQLDLTKFNCKP